MLTSQRPIMTLNHSPMEKETPHLIVTTPIPISSSAPVTPTTTLTEDPGIVKHQTSCTPTMTTTTTHTMTTLLVTIQHLISITEAVQDTLSMVRNTVSTAESYATMMTLSNTRSVSTPIQMMVSTSLTLKALTLLLEDVAATETPTLTQMTPTPPTMVPSAPLMTTPSIVSDLTTTKASTQTTTTSTHLATTTTVT